MGISEGRKKFGPLEWSDEHPEFGSWNLCSWCRFPAIAVGVQETSPAAYRQQGQLFEKSL